MLEKAKSYATNPLLLATGALAGGIFGGKLKSKNEVLATPENKVHTLSSAERKAWFENKQEQITSQSEAVSQRVKQNLKLAAEKSAQEAEALQRELAVTSRDKVIELRPKIIKAMGEQSKVYRSLVDEAMAGKENIPIKTDDLKGFIDSRFAEDPARAAQIKAKLGLTEQVNPLSGKQFGENIPTKLKSQTTLGEVYAQTKSLKQDLSASKVFTAEDKMTDDAIHILSDYMKNNGVDLAEANQFWSKYAPVRDELVSKANPFNQAGTKTKGLADTLIKVSQGKDVNSENFIKETEKILGESITKETKTVIKKMDANEKVSLTNKIDAEIKLAENEALKQKSLKNLTDKEFDIERRALIRTRIKQLFKTLLGLGGSYLFYSELRKLEQ